jgi:hypothetical protein
LSASPLAVARLIRQDDWDEWMGQFHCSDFFVFVEAEVNAAY